jgi:diguanylate cyclase (GGDEF)-like protein
MSRLPAWIAAVMLSTIVVFVMTVGASNSWLSQALDAQARSQSISQIRNARNNLLSQVRLTTLDYAKWGTAVNAIEAADLDWVYENIGAAATVGQIVQIVALWGGHYPADVGWIDDGAEDGRVGLLDSGTIEEVERRLAEIPVGAYDAVEFFAWREGSVYAMSAARLEPADDLDPQAPDGDVERLLMGRRVTNETVASIADSFVLSGLEIVRELPADRPSVPLLGHYGQPIAHLAWDTPHPGSSMLLRMAPVLLLVTFLTAGLAALGMALVRRSAKVLVVAEHRASSAARTDDMTGLPNRAAFNEVLARPAQAGERGILFLDVNDFKRINDSIGHAAGDQVIVDVARRLSRFKAADCFLARLGGDEFVFVVTGPDVEEKIEWLAESAEWALSSPLCVLGRQIRPTVAMGYAVQSDDWMAGDDLLRQADLAMYEAKRKKGGMPVAFSALLQQASGEALAIEKELRSALASTDQFSIAYQPIVGIDGNLERAEALARWTSPELGPVAPDRFIAVAEQAGLVVDLGRKLLHIICDDLVAHPTLKVSVNISPLQLMAPDFVTGLVDHLENRGIDPQRIEVELTESVIVDDLHLAARRLEELHAAGFSTALDDFGTGFSSLGYLGRLCFRTLKIDRSFVSKTRSSPGGVSVIAGMITMAHGLNLLVVCEGIETAEDLELLRRLGCDLAQGYYFERPIPIADLARRWLDWSEAQAAVT